jgi:hypothetical protein
MITGACSVGVGSWHRQQVTVPHALGSRDPGRPAPPAPPFVVERRGRAVSAGHALPEDSFLVRAAASRRVVDEATTS